MLLEWKSGGRQARDWRGDRERLADEFEQCICMKFPNNKKETR